ncbi:ribbon-helix-helix domain-containing protein [Methylobacterium brachythecii]|uniref:Aryl-sulfate sulfotransferase n=1 Tax=Methylobacterium brachythecii TaxID=1176177 RepID=A0A7W6AEE6_9HYPH|nr:ribbon-helix-helix domain-containing protein [Methylobacterium brachythecii]MBB3901752.1 putative DNA-binding ribbon-helix-helix protein [Methylobacterium brachythecii]GLS43891.1 aryl-sulfate sulfotransferase [Methylobacterium brachythecii]
MNDETLGGLKKRSVMIAGHRTSVSLESAFWDVLREIAETRERSVQAMIGDIDAERGDQNLSSAIRVFVLRCVLERSGEAAPTADRAT